MRPIHAQGFAPKEGLALPSTHSARFGHQPYTQSLTYADRFQVGSQFRVGAARCRDSTTRSGFQFGRGWICGLIRWNLECCLEYQRRQCTPSKSDPRWSLVTGSGRTVAEICDKISPGCCRYSAAGKLGWATLVGPSSFDRPTRVSYPTLPELTAEPDRIAGRCFDHGVESLPGLVLQFASRLYHLSGINSTGLHLHPLP